MFSKHRFTALNLPQTQIYRGCFLNPKLGGKSGFYRIQESGRRNTAAMLIQSVHRNVLDSCLVIYQSALISQKSIIQQLQSNVAADFRKLKILDRQQLQDIKLVILEIRMLIIYILIFEKMIAPQSSISQHIEITQIRFISLKPWETLITVNKTTHIPSLPNSKNRSDSGRKSGQPKGGQPYRANQSGSNLTCDERDTQH